MSKLCEFLTCQRVLSLMVFLGFMIHHMLRVNISISIVEMVVKNNFNSSNSTVEDYGPRFNWDEEQKNNILGSFLWGYLLTQVPGGLFSEKFGTKKVLGLGLLAASILSILAPIASKLGYYWLLLSRFFLGAGLGIQWPSIPPIATHWIPPTESSTFMSHTSASSLGAALTLPTCGYLIVYWGWPSVFYVSGSIALIWTLSWFYLVYDTPEQHPRITREEKEKLRKEVKFVDKSVKRPLTPWWKILTSPPVWALAVGNTCSACTFFIAFNQLPTYMSQVLHFNIKENGWFSSLPYLVRYVIAATSSIVADRIIKSKKFSTTSIRKFFSGTVFVGTVCLFIAQALWGYSRIVTVIVFTASLGLMGFATPGLYANSIDIAPAYTGRGSGPNMGHAFNMGPPFIYRTRFHYEVFALHENIFTHHLKAKITKLFKKNKMGAHIRTSSSTIFGIIQVPAVLSGYLTTKFVALVTKDEQGFEQWSYVFWMLVAVNSFASVILVSFLSAEQQPWSITIEQREMEKLKTGNECEKKYEAVS